MDFKTMTPRASRRITQSQVPQSYSARPLSTTLPRSRSATDVQPTESYRTVVLAGNIHCSTCVNHIQNALGRVGPEVHSVSVRVNEISIVHSGVVSTKTLVRILEEESFDVYSAKTIDQDDHVVFEETSDVGVVNTDGWFSTPPRRRFAGFFASRSPPAPDEEQALSRKRKRHLENCAICRNEDSVQPLSVPKHPQLTDLQKSESTTDTSSGSANVSKEVPRQSSGAGSEVTLTNPSWNATLTIGGMTCSACTNSVKDAVSNMPSVQHVQVDLMTNSATVAFSAPENYADRIVEEIEAIGYDASIVTLTETSVRSQNAAKSSISDLYRAQISIEGMTCASCASNVTEGLRELPFVKTVDTVLLSNSSEVVFQGMPNSGKILAAIEALGYDATIESIWPERAHSTSKDTNDTKERTVQIKIGGIGDDVILEHVLEILEHQFGSDLEVKAKPTAKSPILTVSYVPNLPERSIRSIISAIENAGSSLSPAVYHPPSIEERSKEVQRRERKQILYRLLLALAVAVPTFIIGIVFMDLLPDSHPLKESFMHPVWAGSVPAGEWIMLIMATLVYFFAADLFHRRALKEIFALWRPGSRVPVLRRFYRFGSMNLLISAGTSVACVSSVAVLILEATEHGTGTTNSTYFDSVVFLTFFLLLGRFLEAVTKSKTSEAVSVLGKLRPDTARLIVAESSSDANSGDAKQPTKVETIPADLLEIGDIVIVAKGASPPTDGVITQGEGKFDESSLTGESKPVVKAIGETVFVGTINNGNPISVRVSEIGGSSMLDQIVQVVREGLSKRAPVERLADVLTGYFVPIITALAIITFGIWAALGYSGSLESKYIAGQPGGWAMYSLGFAISVFVAACPCGIGLAAPTALFVGIGLAAKHGILVRGGGEAFQDAPHVDAVVFDKTGTLTEGGDLKVTSHEVFSEDDAELAASIATQLEEQSSHPIARAIVEHLAPQRKASAVASDIQEETGYGMRGTFTHNGTSYSAVVGSAALINLVSPGLIHAHATASQTLAAWQNQAQSVAIVAARPSTTDGNWCLLAMFGTSDPVRPSAASTIKKLNKQGIPVYMLSGDNPTTAQAVARTLNIPSTHVFAGVLPTQKADKIHALRAELAASRGASSRSTTHRLFHRSTPSSSDIESQRPHTNEKEKQEPAATTDSPSKTSASASARIAFVGDGINDAPALLAADIGIAMGGGAPVALSAASFVLLRPSLHQIPRLFALSRRVMRRVALNYGWALVYNVVLVPVAAGVLWRTRPEGFVLGPAWAALAMAGSSVSVVVSSLALKWEGRAWKGETDE